ncbi:MAG: energy transducer TonB [Fusobacteriaceae bacterium]|nr:energy transducer TonB [Fusobacteriaceae bacterium]MBN2837991.1 energy transducer TonB [Fusobacteriaceae bacterium]
MKFLFISMIFHLLIILKFFNYQNIQSYDEVEPIVSVSLENFNKERDFEKKDFKKYKHHLKKEKIKDTKFFKKNEVFNNEIKQNEIKKEVVEKILENKNENSQPISKEVEKEILPQKKLDFSEEAKDTTPIVSNPKVELSGSGNIISNTGKGKAVNSVVTNNIVSSSSSNNIFSDYIAGNQDVKGLNYKILKAPNPEYPLIAKKSNYKNKVVIKVRILVNHLGKVEEIKYFDNETKYGFREEVERTLKNWKFSDISLDGKPVKMYFFKSFVFQINN